MTRRDLAWCGLGLGLIVVAGAIGAVGAPGTHNALGLLRFVIVVIGLVLIIQGRRVPAALRVERSRHRLLAEAIRNHHRRRTRGQKD